ncbi:MAG: NYN domain-containing protein [Halobacteriovoraceae bacterium]|nr:NYN domain-containing protein [Halobacteriovoraceae bacterium]
MEKIAIFVDVQNIYYTVKDGLNGQFDYNNFWSKVAVENESVEKAIAYAIDRSDQKQIQFQNILRGIGFKVKLKPYITRKDGSAKGDWDVGITIDMLEAASDVDRLVLLSGDGDFDLLLDRLSSLGKTVDVYGVAHLTADSLIKSASRFFPIDQSFTMQK